LVFYLKKKKNLRAEEIEREDVGDRWSFVNVLPRSGFIHTVHHGKRSEEEADQFVQKIKQDSDGRAPLFISDGWKYEQVLKNNYCHYQPVPYSGRGRPPNPLQVVDPELKYAQVIKRKKDHKLVEVERRVILGKEEEILQIIRREGRGKSINTSYVESRNGNYRKDNKRLTRRSPCHSKKKKFHDAQIDWITAIYNYVDEIVAFRECINPKAKRFEVKYKKFSPAMIEGLTDKRLTFEELLMWKIPKIPLS
jgi:hypothetical protein